MVKFSGHGWLLQLSFFLAIICVERGVGGFAEQKSCVWGWVITIQKYQLRILEEYSSV